ncbi:MAG: nucleotidyltransferase family protein [Armatimonadetes bacterium]|nr:nucleotidyltransferase family protein [Armatimonadota bacterium]
MSWGRIEPLHTLEEIRNALRDHAPVLAERYGVSVVGIFGSYGRGTSHENSDLDLLVEYLKPMSLLELVGAELYLSEALGLKVEMVSARALRKEMRESILREVVAV